MKIFFIHFILLSAFTTQMTAQDTTKTKPCDSVITYKISKYSSKFMMAGQRLTGDKVIERINMFRSSAFEYKQHKKFYTIFTTSLYAGVAAGLAGQIVFSSNHNKQNSTTQSLGILFLINIPVVFIAGRLSSRHFKRSFEFYNREICNRNKNENTFK
jgi:hypothetical protein